MTLIAERSDTPPPPCAVSLSAAARAAVFGLVTLLDSEVYELLVLQAAYLEQKHGSSVAGHVAEIHRLRAQVDDARRQLGDAQRDKDAALSSLRDELESMYREEINALKKDLSKHDFSNAHPVKSTADLPITSRTFAERCRDSHPAIKALHHIHKDQAGFDAFFIFGTFRALSYLSGALSPPSAPAHASV